MIPRPFAGSFLSACLLLLTAAVPVAAAEDVAALLRSWKLKLAWVHPSARLTQWPVDAEHGVFAHALYADCEKAGLQPLPNAPIYGCNFKARFGTGVSQVLEANRERYERLAQLVPSLQDKPVNTGDGLLELPLSLPGHSVRLIELKPPEL